MHNRIFIEEEKEFTLDEFAHLVSRAIRSVASVDIDKDEIKYSRDDVYFTIVDCLGYINERTPGRFRIDQTSFESYLIHFVPDAERKQRASKGLFASKIQSALHIRSTTGELPVWAENDEAILEKIAEIDNQPPAAAPAHIPQKALEERLDVDSQIKTLVDKAVQHFKNTGDILPTVASNMDVLKAFYEALEQEGIDV